MKYMFMVMGEGRGHLTSALAVKDLLEERGHEVISVLVGSSTTNIPEFFSSSFKCEVIKIFSPNCVFEKEKGVNFLKTILVNAYFFPKYLSSLIRIRRIIHELNPDVVINFYEPLFGLYRFLGGKCKKSYVIGNQFMFFHPNYIANKINDKTIEKFLGRLYTRMVGCKAKKIALSLTEKSSYKDITVVPPILRKDVFTGIATNDGFILVYTLSSSCGKKFLNDSMKNIRYEVFVEKFWPGDSDTMKCENIIFNKLDGKKFLDYMKRCEMVICTAGLETASEAAYLGKRIIVIPTENHFEQYFNAWDFKITGLAEMQFKFENLSSLDVKVNPEAIEKFRKWVGSYKDKFIEALNL